MSSPSYHKPTHGRLVKTQSSSVLHLLDKAFFMHENIGVDDMKSADASRWKLSEVTLLFEIPNNDCAVHLKIVEVIHSIDIP